MCAFHSSITLTLHYIKNSNIILYLTKTHITFSIDQTCLNVLSVSIQMVNFLINTTPRNPYFLDFYWIQCLTACTQETTDLHALNRTNMHYNAKTAPPHFLLTSQNASWHEH